jgi:anti-sigma-K factor RskA
MYEESQETLAAEYVLGTLSAEEREHAEALRKFDPGFEASVREWERRLGELNVMVEAVEPPPRVWDAIKMKIAPAETAAKTEPALDKTPVSPVAALASDLAAAEAAAEETKSLPETTNGKPDTPPAAEPPRAAAAANAAFDSAPPRAVPEPVLPADKIIERSREVARWSARARHWRALSFAFGAVALLLALYVAWLHVPPRLLPLHLRLPGLSRLTAKPQKPAPVPTDRLVAVLQQGPTAPAFLLTFDVPRRTLFVRRVSATPDPAKSYELWLFSKRLPAPRSLGIIGKDEFTERMLPEQLDFETLRTATYEVSLEPNGGSPKGAPSGPILFTGKAVEALPAAPPKTGKTGKT